MAGDGIRRGDRRRNSAILAICSTIYQRWFALAGDALPTLLGRLANLTDRVNALTHWPIHQPVITSNIRSDLWPAIVFIKDLSGRWDSVSIRLA